MNNRRIQILFLFAGFFLVQCNAIKVANITNDTRDFTHNNVLVGTKFLLSDDAESAIKDFERMLDKINPNEIPRLFITDDLNGISDKGIATKVKNNRQAYFLETDSNVLTVYAVHSLGVQYGIYGYLSKLGYKWYFPGELWTITPDLKSWYIDISELGRPDFRGRRYFGGGGFPRKHVADPENYVMDSWEEWNRRNRFGADYISKGHAWQDFIRRNKKEIANHPEYVSKSGKQLCVTNPGLQKLFIQDRIKRIGENRKRHGVQDPRALTVGVEPNDGGNHCDCKECNQLGSISNRVFYLANVVAKAIKSEYRDVKVSVMAYNEHAATPDFALEKNIQVSVVAYAFQDAAAPEELIKQWSLKHHDIQVRDYWGLVIWRSGKPVKNFMDHAQKRIATWDRLGVDMMMVESTYGIGVAGIPLYLLAQMGWDKSYDADIGLRQMFMDLYGRQAGAVMQDMMQRWSDNGLIMEFEQALAPIDFEKALELAKTEEQKNRIKSFITYFDYLQLQERVKATKADSPDRRQKLAELIDYNYSIMDQLMIHSYYSPVTMTRIYDRKNFDVRALRTEEKRKSSSYYANLNSNDYTKKITQTDRDLDKVLRSLKIKPRSEITKRSLPHIPNKERLIKTGKSFTLLHESSGPSTFEYDIEVVKRVPGTQKNATIISLYNDKGVIISTNRYVPGKYYQGESISVPGKGKYEIRIRSSNVAAEITWRRSQGIELVSGTTVDFGKYYIITESKGELFVTGHQNSTFYQSDIALNVLKKDKLLRLQNVSSNKFIEVISKSVIVPSFNCKIFL